VAIREPNLAVLVIIIHDSVIVKYLILLIIVDVKFFAGVKVWIFCFLSI